jgi:hypothetical protein
MGRSNTGIPWPRGYYDLERGRPAVPRVGVFRARVTGYHGEIANLNLLDEKTAEQNSLLAAILVVLNSMADTNITKEEVEQ